ncbi:MAG: transcriptional regulator TrmB [Parcubacteria group bacterium Gr01-1014_24]|nr:MAG: transcriptional regulator TrmB [Parcubacteria group bacterium Gr01-1014_24]
MTRIQQQEHINLEQSLIEIGLSKKEAGVYIALLLLGHGTVSQISRRANINRTTGYDILDSLSTKGLVSISGKEPKQEYSAESPENLSKFISEDIKNKNEALKKTEEIIPELKSIHNVKDRPKVFFYEGREGLEKVYEDTLTSTETIRAYANVEHMNAGLPGYFPEYFKRRASKGIFIRGIGPKTEENIELGKRNVEEKREMALVPRDKYDFVPEINIYDNKVMIASWHEQLGIIIESTEIADAMKVIYELAWAEAKRLDKTEN